MLHNSYDSLLERPKYFFNNTMYLHLYVACNGQPGFFFLFVYYLVVFPVTRFLLGTSHNVLKKLLIDTLLNIEVNLQLARDTWVFIDFFAIWMFGAINWYSLLFDCIKLSSQYLWRTTYFLLQKALFPLHQVRCNLEELSFLLLVLF